MTKYEFARQLGLKPRQIDNLVAEGMPRKKDGRSWVYTAESEAWYWKRKVDAVARATKSQLDGARTRREIAQAERAEFELAQLRREWIPFAEAKKVARGIAELVTARLRAAPGRYAYLWQASRTPQDAQQALEGIVREIITDLKSVMLEAGGNGSDRPRPRRRKRAPRGGG